jgi:hypothetical protein
MRQLLRRHPNSCCLAAANLEVDIARPHGDRLVLSYVVSGKMSDIRMPPRVAAARSDELWRHTCFEAFVRASSGDLYYEFNFAPSTHWQAYRFTGYRSGMCVAPEIGMPPIEVRSTPNSYTLEVSLRLNCLSALPRDSLWRLGLSALIEDTVGRKSYWALAHPPGKPDFHHADCFAHEFSPVVPS